MTVSSADTAELPRVRALVLDEPAVSAPPAHAAPAAPPPADLAGVGSTVTGLPPVESIAEAPVLAETPVIAIPGIEVPSDEAPVRPVLVLEGPVRPTVEPTAEGAPAAYGGRAALRAERRRAQRERRLWAVLGVSLMLLMLGITVAVLDVVH